ncbi:hypothetical protein, variant [Exophiala xenobiotica]|uniref:UBX domain-containing protein n=1 Tax=Exophiala xenobiotica TaxID=348802 RepID=A0A0D2DFB6_9EURO|nr:hypothetical protein, variant [Exophiala xenobiotica]KIW60967.1 hypothetical protein, variant [Exophiala xenobiotica]
MPVRTNDISNGQLQENLQSAEVSTTDLERRLMHTFGVEDAGDETAAESNAEQGGQTSQREPEYLDLQPVTGGMRLPNNAYDALRDYTQKLLDGSTSPSEVFETQLNLMNNIPIFHDEVKRLREGARREVSEYARSRLLRLPAVGLRIPSQAQSSSVSTVSPRSQPQRPAPPSPAPLPVATTPQPQQHDTASLPSDRPTTDRQKAQRAEYIKMQREREQKQRDERERIKAQIKADREERRRLDELRKQGEPGHPSSEPSPASKTRNTEVRVQVRTFDGSTLRSTFQATSTLTKDIRPWIDSESTTTAPYNLKLILTPLPNRSIEAAEEDQELRNLGIVGSCTFVMVPVKGYVESYTGSSTGGLLSSAVSGGYNLVSGTAGMVFGGVKSILGYNQPTTVGNASSNPQGQSSTPQNAARNVRVRTLADQRAESAKRDQQFYNGNQLNFEPNKDDNDKKD